MFALIAAGLAVFTLFGLGPSGSPLLAVGVGVVAFAVLAASARGAAGPGAAGGAGLPRCARGSRGRSPGTGHRTGGAAATGFEHVVAAPVERSAAIDRPTHLTDVEPLQVELRQALEDGLDPPHAVVAGALCGNLLDAWPALWTFAHIDGVEPTNNAAERALRPAVLWRKGSFGTQSDSGSRFVERIMTVAATCKQQGRGLLDFLVTAVTAARLGLPPPSLIPASAV